MRRGDANSLSSISLIIQYGQTPHSLGGLGSKENIPASFGVNTNEEILTRDLMKNNSVFVFFFMVLEFF